MDDARDESDTDEAVGASLGKSARHSPTHLNVLRLRLSLR